MISRRLVQRVVENLVESKLIWKRTGSSLFGPCSEKKPRVSPRTLALNYISGRRIMSEVAKETVADNDVSLDKKAVKRSVEPTISTPTEEAEHAKKAKDEGQELDEEAEAKRIDESVRFKAWSRSKPKKYALLLSYCGAGYFGLQRNIPYPTIEEELLAALRKSDAILEEHFNKPQLLYFNRAARTDKGVSAAKQIISCRLRDDFPSKIPEINQHLPEKIRLIAAKRTTRFFDCKNYCDARTYAYMMPSYSLCPPEDLTCDAYRITKDKIVAINAILAYYLGTHNYHNFTSQKEATDASAQRYIMSMECGEAFETDGLEFVIIRIKGQSFMLHQIRKMIGLALAIVRGFATIETLKKAFHTERIDIPKAPGLGLMLEEVHYDRYNQRYGGDGIHEPLSWGEYSDQVFNFKKSYIYTDIVETERKEHPMISWLQTLPVHTYLPRAPGPPSIAADGSHYELPVRDRTLYTRAALNAGLFIPDEVENKKGTPKVGEEKEDEEVIVDPFAEDESSGQVLNEQEEDNLVGVSSSENEVQAKA